MAQRDSVDAIARFLWPKHPIANLARALNVPNRRARDWLAGYRNIPPDKCRALANVLIKRANGFCNELEIIAEGRELTISKRKTIRVQNLAYNRAHKRIGDRTKL